MLVALWKQPHSHDFDALNYPAFAIYSVLTLNKCLSMPLQVSNKICRIIFLYSQCLSSSNENVSYNKDNIVSSFLRYPLPKLTYSTILTLVCKLLRMKHSPEILHYFTEFWRMPAYQPACWWHTVLNLVQVHQCRKGIRNWQHPKYPNPHHPMFHPQAPVGKILM